MFSGLIPAMVTPFDEWGDVDPRATEAVVEWFVEAGVDGISALGSTGEFSHLDTNERRRFAEELVGIVAGRVPLVIGVGAAGTREAVALARHAEEREVGGRRIGVCDCMRGRKRDASMKRPHCRVQARTSIDRVEKAAAISARAETLPANMRPTAVACGIDEDSRSGGVRFSQIYAYRDHLDT